MGSFSVKTPLIVITGATGSGKTSLAIKLALRFNCEIICADSRTVFKGMDIGTAKPSAQELALVSHHLLDVTTPDHPITVADFKSFAQDKIDEIHARGKVPFLVGGTGLYIDAVIFDYGFRGKADTALRQELNRLSVDELQAKVLDMNLELPENSRNKRHLIRLIEAGFVQTGQRHLRDNTLVLGLEIEKSELEARLQTRIQKMFDEGLEQEVRNLAERYGWECQSLQTIGYQEFRPYLDGVCSLDEVKEAILTHSRQYAKRQKTWFRRNKGIHYILKFDDSVDLITTFLNKKV